MYITFYESKADAKLRSTLLYLPSCTTARQDCPVFVGVYNLKCKVFLQIKKKMKQFRYKFAYRKRPCKALNKTNKIEKHLWRKIEVDKI